MLHINMDEKELEVKAEALLRERAEQYRDPLDLEADDVLSFAQDSFQEAESLVKVGNQDQGRALLVRILCVIYMHTQLNPGDPVNLDLLQIQIAARASLFEVERVIGPVVEPNEPHEYDNEVPSESFYNIFKAQADLFDGRFCSAYNRLCRIEAEMRKSIATDDADSKRFMENGMMQSVIRPRLHAEFGIDDGVRRALLLHFKRPLSSDDRAIVSGLKEHCWEPAKLAMILKDRGHDNADCGESKKAVECFKGAFSVLGLSKALDPRITSQYDVEMTAIQSLINENLDSSDLRVPKVSVSVSSGQTVGEIAKVAQRNMHAAPEIVMYPSSPDPQHANVPAVITIHENGPVRVSYATYVPPLEVSHVGQLDDYSAQLICPECKTFVRTEVRLKTGCCCGSIAKHYCPNCFALIGKCTV